MAILVAACLLLLMGFAAIAVDLGAGFNERRQDQSAADFGALAAVQFAIPSPACGSSSACATSARINGANEAITVASAGLDNPAAANWADPYTCGTPPTGFTPVSSVSSCVAFNTNAQQAWVRIPTIDSPTFFGKVLGAASIPVSAEAVAGSSIAAPGAVLPFLLPGIATTDAYNCLKTGPNPSWGACEDLPSTGNFGSMDFFLYGNENVGSTTKCSGDTNGRLVYNMARGVDHPVGIHPTGTGSGKQEPEMCPIFSAQADMVQGQSGVGSALEDGMLYGGTSYSTTGAYDGRIEDSGGTLVRNSQGFTPAARIDSTTLWSYLRTDLGGTGCDKSSVDTPAEMIACITWAKTNNRVVFTDGIIGSPRFGFTPEVYEFDFSTPGAYYHIKGYRPVYIDTTYYGCNSSGCTAAHTPGIANTPTCPAAPDKTTCGIPAAGNKTLDAITAYILHTDIMPDIAKTPSPGALNQRTHNLRQ